MSLLLSLVLLSATFNTEYAKLLSLEVKIFYIVINTSGYFLEEKLK